MPAVMTPGGPLDLSTVMFRNRIIFIGQPVNSQVAQRVISQLVTLATIDEDADILVIFTSIYLCILNVPTRQTDNDIGCLFDTPDIFKLPWWKHLLYFGNL